MWPRAKPRPPCTTARYTTSLMPILHQSGPRYHTGMATQTVPLQESKILRAFSEKTPRSRALHQRALSLLPNGVTHIGRYLEPHSVYIERAQGARKWDVDGNEYVDYLGGHGALLLGHNHPVVLEAVAAPIARGAHY